MNSDKYKEFLVVIILSITGLCVVGQLYLPLPLLNELSQHYKSFSFSSSWIVAAFGYAYAVGFLIFGPLSDRLGRFRVIIVGLISLVVVTAWVAFTNNGITLLVSRMIQGFIAASFPPVALAYVNEQLQPKARGLAVACLSFSFLSAIALAQVLVLALEAKSLAVPEWFMMGIYIILVILLAILLNRDKTNHQTSLLSVWSKLPTLLIHQSLWFFYVLTISLLLVFIGFYVSFTSQMTSLFSPLELRLFTLPFFVTCFFASRVLQIFGRKKALLIALSIGLLALSIMWIAINLSAPLGMFLALCILSSSVALLVPLLIACIAQSAPIESRGAAVSLYTFLLFCGASAAPLLFKSISGVSALVVMMVLYSISFVIISGVKHE